jgi:hypothetical protein
MSFFVESGTDFDRHVRVLLDKQQRDSLRRKRRNDFEHLLDNDRRQAHRRFIHQDDLRPRHQGAPDCNHLLFAAGKRPRELTLPLLQPRKALEYAIEVLLKLGLLAKISAHQQIFAHAHPGEHTAPFENNGHAGGGTILGWFSVERDLLERHLAAGRRHETRERSDERRLAGAVAAEKTDGFTLLHGETYSGKGFDRTVAHTQCVHTQHAQRTPEPRGR